MTVIFDNGFQYFCSFDVYFPENALCARLGQQALKFLNSLNVIINYDHAAMLDAGSQYSFQI